MKKKIVKKIIRKTCINLLYAGFIIGSFGGVTNAVEPTQAAGDVIGA